MLVHISILYLACVPIFVFVQSLVTMRTQTIWKEREWEEKRSGRRTRRNDEEKGRGDGRRGAR